jgi:hypothetical protein
MLWALRGTWAATMNLQTISICTCRQTKTKKTYVKAFSRRIFWTHGEKLEISPVFTSQFQRVTINMYISINLSYPITGLDKTLGLQEVEAPRISRQSAHEGGKFVSPTYRPRLPTRTYPSFPLEAEPIIVRSEGLSQRMTP